MANLPADRPEGGKLDAEISRAVVRLLADSTGRGPTQSRTTIDRDLIVVVLQNTLTPGER
ncbi:MAG TPA: Na-translocating system protein MpsC family protein [Solirubrobacter sp.]|nr:Na-translocating system protein MpsC family protein [Solirubrobacter sp.]